MLRVSFFFYTHGIANIWGSVYNRVYKIQYLQGMHRKRSIEGLTLTENVVLRLATGRSLNIATSNKCKHDSSKI